MTDIFKTKYDKADMEAADDAKWAPGPVQTPKETPWAHVPDQFAKRHWPAPVVSVKRPRFGHDY